MTGQDTLYDKLQVMMAGRPGCHEAAVFGLQGFLLNGNVCCAVDNGQLLVRVASETCQQYLGQPGYQPFYLGGQPLAGWLLVDSSRLSPHELLLWVERACDHVGRLPAKKAGR